MPASRALVVALALSGTAHGAEPCRAADDFVLSFDTATSVYNNLGGLLTEMQELNEANTELRTTVNKYQGDMGASNQSKLDIFENLEKQIVRARESKESLEAQQEALLKVFDVSSRRRG